MTTPAFWAIALAIAQTLLGGCAGPPRPAPGAGASGLLFARPPPDQVEPIDVEAFARRLDAEAVPAPGADLPSRGPPDAPVTIQVWSDFECPFCAEAVPVLRMIESEFAGSVRVVWRNLPLPGHAHAEFAATAASVVFRTRGGAAFWRFHDALFEASRRGLDERLILELASRESVPAAAVRRALETGADGQIAADVSAADRVGVEGTPAFLVNDWLAVGVLPLAEFRALVDRALGQVPRRARRI